MLFLNTANAQLLKYSIYINVIITVVKIIICNFNIGLPFHIIMFTLKQ